MLCIPFEKVSYIPIFSVIQQSRDAYIKRLNGIYENNLNGVIFKNFHKKSNFKNSSRKSNFSVARLRSLLMAQSK